jgi:hypothetical protein
LNIFKAGAVPKGWARAADPTLDDFQNVEIALLDMNWNEDSSANYDWYTNTGGTAAPTVLWHGAAQYQLYRFVLTMDDVAGSVGMIRPVRFTVDQDAKSTIDQTLIRDIPILKGQQVRITATNPDSQSLLRYEFTVVSGLESGSAFRRVIEAQVNLGASLEPFVLP